MAEATAFDSTNPPLRVTNPDLATSGVTKTPFIEYPRHLHRADGTYCVVTSDAEKAAKLEEGWHLTPGDAHAARQKSSRPAKPAA